MSVKVGDNWAVKHRPTSLKHYVGQDAIVSTINGMLKRGEVPRTLLITGGTGLGKTTLARIVAYKIKGLEKAAPHPDIMEENNSNDRGIDAVRSLIENIKYMPTQGKYRIYILDEVHMWTPAAVQAMLKPLEEPPPHVIFILVTNQPHKLPETVIRRCVRLSLQMPNPADIIPALTRVAEKEKVFQPPAKFKSLFKKVAEAAGGQPAQALQILQNVANLHADKPFSGKEDMDEAIGNALKQLGIANEQIAIMLLLSLYGRKKTAIKVLFDTDEFQNLIYHALQLNGFLMEVASGRETWRSLAREVLEAQMVKRDLKPNVVEMTIVQEGLTALASRLVTAMSVSERSIALAGIGRTLANLMQIKDDNDE